MVVAPIAEANINPPGLTAQITVATKEMKVLNLTKAEKDRAEIQSTMLGPKVLDQEKFPEIRFKSSRIEQTSPQHYRVAGMLELHGTKHEVTLKLPADRNITMARRS